ncbi:flagellar hook-basal body complex protein [Neobacillus sp. OS1-32]|uniref:flagellar hook-basal body complex protein n=1 Tax=Neobacillus sp. OS1-32 TaxID=3070682 RepID=UPI0027E1DDEE|nr:flagellar hook-basal body complex protein [Neobacillus sp. OS1-32]WML31566.1 flagellar hook-basal body complex protein [Neobacillus sp. OS1-32]
MLKSLYSGVSGMKGFQTKLDVIGNNVANVNTVGFKKGRVVFQDLLNQTLSGGTTANNQRGGINPQQVGLGSKIATIDTIHTPGSPMTTNVGTDLAIDGDAFFVVSPDGDDTNKFLTKAGNFTLDGQGRLVDSNGNFVLGVANGVAMPIKIATDEVAGKKFTSYSIDSDGYINVVDKDGKIGKLAYDGSKYFLNNPNQAGYDETKNLSIATSVVQNPAGLKKVGNSLFEVTGNAGTNDFGRIKDNAGGEIYSGVLEMSNVDLTEEFTEMIIAQRGFQANARTITTSDSILEEIVNLKR